MNQYFYMPTTPILSKLILFLTFSLVPLLSIPHTMAARNILLALVFVAIPFCNLDWSIYKGRLNIFYIFSAYLVIHLIFFSTDFDSAFKNFRSEWLKFILFSVLGLTVPLLVSQLRLKRALLWFGISFSIPLLIYLIFLGYEWVRLPDGFPWGFLGIYSAPGELVYTSLAATILLSVYLCFQAFKLWEYLFSIACILLSVVPLAIIRSRGGVLFCILTLFLVSLYAFLRNLKQFKSSKMIALISFTPIALIILITLYLSNSSDLGKWGKTFGNLRMGAAVMSMPFEVACNGTEIVYKKFNSDESLDQKTLNTIQSIDDGDGARVLGAIVGARLAVENPMGIDQSRQAYQIALASHCNALPSSSLSHSHNGWINVALGIGIPGAIILFSLFVGLAVFGYRRLVVGGQYFPYASALTFSTCIWFMRALLDGTMQDQILEIQAFSMALLFGLTVSEKPVGSKPS